MEIGKDKDGFATHKITTWDEFTKTIDAFEPTNEIQQWIFRGQSQDWPLSTKMDRALKSWEVDPAEGDKIEFELEREFRRRYKGTDYRDVRKNKLYCFALMQHHGAPTRLQHPLRIKAGHAQRECRKDFRLWPLR
jgi:hypothetical protein